MTRGTAPAAGTIAALTPDTWLDLMVPGHSGQGATFKRVRVIFIERYAEVTRITMRDRDGVKYVRGMQERDPIQMLTGRPA